jgi:hypothetical protein
VPYPYRLSSTAQRRDGNGSLVRPGFFSPGW